MIESRSRSKSRVLAALILLTLLAFLAIPATRSAGAKEKEKVEYDKVQVGDIVATGFLDAAGLCQFEPFETVTESTGKDNEKKWLSYEINDSCQIVVVAKWKGKLKDGPSDVVDPILPYPDDDEASESSSVASPALKLAAPMSYITRTSDYMVFTYGGGGENGDKLTVLHGKLTYSYNGSSVWVNSTWHNCWGATWPIGWDWVYTGCYRGNPTSQVGMWARGVYYCKDTDPNAADLCFLGAGYHHQLNMEMWAYPSGSSYCTWTATGTVVFGPKSYITSGCQ